MQATLCKRHQHLLATTGLPFALDQLKRNSIFMQIVCAIVSWKVTLRCIGGDLKEISPKNTAFLWKNRLISSKLPTPENVYCSLDPMMMKRSVWIEATIRIRNLQRSKSSWAEKSAYWRHLPINRKAQNQWLSMKYRSHEEAINKITSEAKYHITFWISIK